MIKVGLTEGHGTAYELMASPPADVEYRFLGCTKETPRWVRSPIKGFLRSFEAADTDVIEAVLCPIFTQDPWICTLACYPEALAFQYGALPSPRATRAALIERLLAADNCRGLIFWSEAGLRTMSTYGGVTNPRIVEKAQVVRPSMRLNPTRPADTTRPFTTLLFSGDFFRKGGVNVVDAFVVLHQKYGHLRLKVCSSEDIDFGTPNKKLRDQYLAIVKSHPGIDLLGRVSRNHLLDAVLPVTDAYLLPTYAETYGFAVLEAMAYGVPVVATNVFAIPEMIDDMRSGLLIDVGAFNVEQLFRTYVVDSIPNRFRQHVTHQLIAHLTALIENQGLRRKLSIESVDKIRTRFSVERRNQQLARIYSAALIDVVPKR